MDLRPPPRASSECGGGGGGGDKHYGANRQREAALHLFCKQQPQISADRLFILFVHLYNLRSYDIDVRTRHISSSIRNIDSKPRPNCAITALTSRVMLPTNVSGSATPLCESTAENSWKLRSSSL